MNIGITFDLKDSAPAAPGTPDDHQEEFDSPATIEALAAVLRGLGHQVALLGDGPEMVRKVLAAPPDFVFNFAEGTGTSRSREARVPALLELLGIPHTGSDPLTMAVTLDKDMAKRLVASAGVTVPPSLLIHPGATPPADAKLRYPVVVKPAWEGSSKGIRQRCLVREPAELPGVLQDLHRDHPQPALVEEYIQGPEVTVGLVGNGPPHLLGIMEVCLKQPTEHFVYSLEIKRDYRRLIDYHCPARLSAPVLEAVERAARTAWDALSCRDVARMDFRIRDGVPYFLEINPLPGLNPDDSDLVIMAGLVGWSYERLIAAILQAALQRTGS